MVSVGPGRMTIPPVKCSATSRGTGQRCQRYAIVGGTVCWNHGGAAGQVVRKAKTRHLLANLLASDPRPVWEVLLDAVHTADAVARDVKVSALTEAEETGTVSADTVARLVEHAKHAHALSSAAITTRAIEHQAHHVERQANVDAALLAPVLGHVVDRLADLLTGLGLTPGERTALATWTSQVVRDALSVASVHLHERSKGITGTLPPSKADFPPPPPIPPRVATLQLARPATYVPCIAPAALARLPRAITRRPHPLFPSAVPSAPRRRRQHVPDLSGPLFEARGSNFRPAPPPLPTS